MDKTDLASALALAYIEKNGASNENQSFDNFFQNFLFVRGEMEKLIEANQSVGSISPVT